MNRHLALLNILVRTALGLGLLLPTSASAQACNLSDIKFITEHSPPFSYLEGDVAAGTAVNTVLAITKAAGCPIDAKDIQVMPWARGFRSALQLEKHAIFSITKTPERLPLFQWVGPIGTGTYGLIGKRNRQFNLASLSDRAQYQYGTIRDDVGEQYLKAFGITEEKISLAVLGTSMAKMIQGDRIDLWAYSETSAKDSLKVIGADEQAFSVVHVFASNQFYLAFSRDVDPKTIAALQQELGSLTSDSSNTVNTSHLEAQQ